MCEGEPYDGAVTTERPARRVLARPCVPGHHQRMGGATGTGRKGRRWCLPVARPPRIAEARRVVLLTLAAAVLTAGCGPTVAVSSTLSNGRSLYLQASFTEGTVSLTAIGAADVPAGTAGTLEILGPVDWSCPGVFTAYPARDYDGLPWANIPLFTVGGDPEQGFDGPAGNYRFRLTLT